MASKTSKKVVRRQKIRYKIRKKIMGTTELPRLSVFRSNNAIYVQVIDDTAGHTLVASSSTKINATGSGVEVAKLVGKSIAEKAKAAGIDNVVFDRSGYLYHGRVKAVAEGAREGGLTF